MKTKYKILIAARNFGCGSSREHAPIALGASGCEVVVAESYARIFFRNCIATGEVYPYELTESGLSSVVKTGDYVEVDFEKDEIRTPHGTFKLNPLGEVKPDAAAVDKAAAAIPPQIRAVFFDLGKVLVHFDWTRSLEEISRRSPNTPAEAWRITYNDGARHEYECGRISTPDFFESLRGKLQFDGTAIELEHLWCDIFTPMDAHIALAQEIAKTHIVGIISNTNAAHIDFLEPLYPMFQIFPKERRIYSHDVKCMKPDRHIYDLALATAGTTPETTLFIDDLEDNIHGVRALGWHGVHLRPETDLAAELGALGLVGSKIVNATLLMTLVIALATPLPVPAESKCDVKKIYGKIQFVNSFPDYKVKAVTSFPDLKVKIVTSFPDGPGKWQIVTSFPDYKVQMVESFPDFTIQFE
ncbi:hypothetical protein FGG08_007618 [Glutinoglossum americanum]|uniref:3-isopropylmalate dehydratase n=1 Tax=Glutinoglossum americanum TaxID=1670608 RepID=A0A9P8KW82_9PEZI|nr:hypothetical protein FGG08_007618 [Glutinoglossum americanum]